MRLFKSTTVNWKYIIGEILLIFFGISLAIWFNNWNASNTINANKKIAIDKIEDEIISNNNGEAVAGISEMMDFQETFPNFFIKKDSVQINDSLYRYLGNTRIRLELTAFSQIAWETSRNMGIANEFDFECLYNLENVYNIQQLVQNEMDKAAEALQNKEIDRLERILGFVSQLDVQLEDAYNSMLKNIGDCM